MGNNGIERYFREGWHFRIKTVKGHRYITRRKGQEERSLGAFNNSLWIKIQQLKKQYKPEDESPLDIDDSIQDFVKENEDKLSEKRDRSLKIKEVLEKIKKIKEQLDLDRTVTMMTTCVHREEGYCNFWSWGEKPKFLEIHDDIFGSASENDYKRKIMFWEGEKVNRWVVRVAPWFCSNCPSYSLETKS